MASHNKINFMKCELETYTGNLVFALIVSYKRNKENDIKV